MALKKLEYFCFPGSLPTESAGRKVTAAPLRCIRSARQTPSISALQPQTETATHPAWIIPPTSITRPDRLLAAGLCRCRGAGLSSGQGLEQPLHVRKGDILGRLQTPGQEFNPCWVFFYRFAAFITLFTITLYSTLMCCPFCFFSRLRSSVSMPNAKYGLETMSPQ